MSIFQGFWGEFPVSSVRVYHQYLQGCAYREIAAGVASTRSLLFFFSPYLASSQNSCWGLNPERCILHSWININRTLSCSLRSYNVSLTISKSANNEGQNTSRKYLIGTPLPQMLHSSPRVRKVDAKNPYAADSPSWGPVTFWTMQVSHGTSTHMQDV